MNNYDIIIHLAYLITFVALSIKDVLFLRIVLSVACLLQVVYQLGFNNNPDIAVWNTLFLATNLIQVVKLIKERAPVKIPDDIVDIYRTKFSDMTHREFLYFWSLGKQKNVTDSALIKEGEYQKSLFLILSGNAAVSRDGRVIATLHRPEFVGEISFITREPASANVDAKSILYYIEWDQEELRRVKAKNVNFWTKLNQCLGEDLARKIKHNSIIKTEETEKSESK
tara:strand:+ start:3073 stop:3750 length:678 start_codon:yes stop_codon:yes gene_type:complete